MVAQLHGKGNILPQSVFLYHQYLFMERSLKLVAETFLVCVFCYKNTDNLEKTIKSIAMQNYTSIHVIVSDDHSIDDVALQKKRIENITELYKDRIPQIEINVNASNMGTVKHINYILKKTDERYICLLGSGDELYDQDSLLGVVTFFEKNPEKLICTSKRLMCFPSGKEIVRPGEKTMKIIKQGGRCLLNYTCRGVNPVISIGTFFTRPLFEKYGYFDENYILLEDAPYILHLLFSDVSIGVLNEITCKYDTGGISNGKRRNKQLIIDSIETLRNIKYKRRAELSFFTKRIVTVKYFLRVKKDIMSILKSCLCYPDAVLYLIYLSTKDWLSRNFN